MKSDAELPPATYSYREPCSREVALVVSAPHVGTYVPPAIAAAFADRKMDSLPMTDWHVHRLYDFVPELGGHFVHATVSRLVIDLNRPPDSRPLYSGRFETGLVATRTFQGEKIFATPPDAADVESRKKRYYDPYHHKLKSLIDDVRARFGFVILLDAHSVASHKSLVHGRLDKDIYLGNRDGQASGTLVFDFLKRRFESNGLQVAANDPYKGGYITHHYGNAADVQAVQIEMCQRVYMSEAHPDRTDDTRFREVSAMLRGVIGDFLAEVSKIELNQDFRQS